tara:strand:+ start:373 stop:657 length:285 start_codon:yes stop_codon:yes gene_type:complete
MKYLVTSTWKHSTKIDEEQQRAYMSVFKNLNVHENIIWFRIDEQTHGSVAIYPSKEAYLEFKDANAMQRGISNELGITMTYEVEGETFAELQEL